MYPRTIKRHKDQINHFISFIKNGTIPIAISKNGNLSPGTIDNEHYQHFFVTLDNLVQGIRKDLQVVDGDIDQMIESFIKIEYDKFKLIKDPNPVD